ncbi:MAG: hypothetical protein HY318_01430, partial [Armatimonadetes bacterium]|nr:hypothetical protein [Armatimonadota bacterium]
TALIELEGAPADLVATALFNRGVTKGQQGDTTGEIADYTAVIELRGVSAKQVAQALVNRGVMKGEQGDTTGEIADCTAAAGLAGAPADCVVMALFNRGIAKRKLGDTGGEVADYTAVIELDDAPADHVAMALFNRGVTKWKQSDAAGAIADFSKVAQLKGATTGIRMGALPYVFWHAWPNYGQGTDHSLAVVTEVLGGLSNEERNPHLLAFFAQIAGFGIRGAWLYAFHALTKDQPEEVIRQLEPLPVVAEVLESGDMSRFDPLPPEQRDFALEVLRKFEPENPG